MKKTTSKPPVSPSTLVYGNPPGTVDPLRTAVVMYAAGPLPGTYLYAAPQEPWFPPLPTVPATEPTVPSVAVEPKGPFPLVALEKRMGNLEQQMCEIKVLLEGVLAGLKVREAVTEMLEKIGGKKP